jgi:hypothetical protein
MSVLPPGDPAAEDQDAAPSDVDHAQEMQVGEHGVQDNRFTQVTAGHDALVAGRDFRVQHLHLHVGDAGAGITRERIDSAGLGAPTYYSQVRDIAPPVLEAREAELAEVARFCSGAEPYSWWQAPPWAGKTALASWIVLHPPSGVVVVSFFITGRLAGQADSDAFTAALVSQLAALAGVQPAVTASPAERDAERRWLLSATVSQLTAARKRLLLVVDGLDEDQGRHPSIAALLPPRPPPGLRVLVTSRPFPGIPIDVPGDHPLRGCKPRMLSAFPGARGIEAEARRDFDRLSAQDAEIVGLLAASGGGLTIAELAALTVQPEYAVRARLSSSFGRILTTRAAGIDGDRVIMFAHETLRATAESELGSDLARYRELIHRWADDHACRGWPESTPRFLLQPYGRMLADQGDARRFARIAADPARQDLMVKATYGDTASLAELDAGLALGDWATAEGLRSLAVLSLGRDRVLQRGARIPRALPGAWAGLGNVSRAETLARGLQNDEERACALADVACLLADRAPIQARQAAGHAEWITQGRSRTEDRPNHYFDVLARMGSEVFSRTSGLAWQSLVRTAEALARTGQVEAAERVAAEIPDAYICSTAWSAIIAAGHGTSGRADAAYAAALSASTGFEQVEALVTLARSLRLGDSRRARETALKALDLAVTAPCPMLTLEDLDRVEPADARRCHDQMAILRTSVKMLTPGHDDEINALLAEASARCGLFLHVDLASYALARAQLQELVFSCFAGMLVDAAYARGGSLERAANLQEMIMIEGVERAVLGSFLRQGLLATAHTIRSGGWDSDRMWCTVLADWGAAAEAEQAARASGSRVELLARLARRLAGTDAVTAARLANEAEESARDVPPDDRTMGLVSAAYSLLGRSDRAAAVMGQMSFVPARLKVWNRAALRRTDPAQAGRIPETRPYHPGTDEAESAHAWAISGEVESAERELSSATPYQLSVLTRTLADSGYENAAERIAAGLARRGQYELRAWCAIARARARNHQRNQALALVERMLQMSARIRDPEYRADAHVTVVAACADVDPDRAAAIARTPGIVPDAAQGRVYTRLMTLIGLAVALRQADRTLAISLLEEAGRLVEEISSRDHDTWEWLQPADALAVASACLGLWDRAEHLWQVSASRPSTLVASIMAGVPDPDIYLLASGWRTSIGEPWLPPELGLIGAATGRSPNTPTDLPRARCMIAQVLRSGKWTQALTALAGTDPDIALELCERFHAQLVRHVA